MATRNCSGQEQAKDTVDQLEEFGLAVKAEPIEGERSNEQDADGSHMAPVGTGQKKGTKTANSFGEHCQTIMN